MICFYIMGKFCIYILVNLHQRGMKWSEHLSCRMISLNTLLPFIFSSSMYCQQSETLCICLEMHTAIREHR